MTDEAGRRLVVLHEYQSDVVALSDGAVRDLATLAASRIVIGMGPEPGTWKLTATQHVGTVVTADVEILVRPKVPLENLFLLLDVELPPVAWGDLPFGYHHADHLLAAFAELFTRKVEHTLATGVLRSYRQHQERETVLRGRIDVPRLMRLAGLPTPIPCRYDELTADIDENRYLKAAVRRLLRVPGVQPSTRTRLRRVLVQLEGVTDTSLRPEDLDGFTPTRLSRYYDGALRLARLVLANLGFVDRAGDNDASSFMLDMNDLFQRWVTDRLRRHLRGRLTVDAEPPMHLGEHRLVPMAPDLAFRQGGSIVYVGDVKYKLTDTGLGRASDYYQLLAYTTVTGLPAGVLIYCQHTSTTPQRSLTVQRSGHQLRTYPLDLQGDQAAVESSIAALADWIAAAAEPATA